MSKRKKRGGTMKFLLKLAGTVLALGLAFMCVTGIIASVKGEGHMEYIKSWGNPAVEETIEDETPADEITEDNQENKEVVA